MTAKKPVILRATSDLHLTERTAPWVFAALRELRDDSRACQKLTQENYTFILGDVLDQALTVHMPTYVQLRSMLQTWPGKVYVLPGNHDQYSTGARYESRWENALVPLNGQNCRVVSMPVWGRLGRYLPYVKPETWAEELNRITGKPVGDRYCLDIVWCHNGFRGAYRNAMSMDRDGVSCLDIPRGHVVVTGHYHMPQNLGRIVYCGSPYETSFAEEGQAKGWLRWENALEDPIPVRVPFGDLGAPRHYTIEWDPTKGPPTIPVGMKPTDRPRIVTNATRKDALAQAKQLRKAGLEGVPILAKPMEASTRGVVDPRLGPREAVGAYVHSVLGPDGTKPDPGAMVEYAEEAGLWGA